MKVSASEGLAVRRRVMGGGHVAARQAGTDTFEAPLQDFLNENCWGFTWIRAGLELRERSLIALTALAAGGHWTEFAAHVRGALRNGWTEAELQEAFLHLAVYLGAPATVEAFRTGARAVAEHRTEAVQDS